MFMLLPLLVLPLRDMISSFSTANISYNVPWLESIPSKLSPANITKLSVTSLTSFSVLYYEVLKDNIPHNFFSVTLVYTGTASKQQGIQTPSSSKESTTIQSCFFTRFTKIKNQLSLP